MAAAADARFADRCRIDSRIVYTTTPQNVMKYVAFMTKIGAINVKPDGWRDLFFPNAHALPGS